MTKPSKTMTVQKSAPKEGIARKRRAHQKSRRGCRNCKSYLVPSSRLDEANHTRQTSKGQSKSSPLLCINIPYRPTNQCDETRPACSKCISFSVTCNYDSGSKADLQPSYDRQVTLTLLTPPTTPLSKTSQAPGPKIWIPTTLSPLYVSGDDVSSFQLDAESLGRIDRFQHRTVKTIGTKNAANLFGALTLDLAFAVLLPSPLFLPVM